MAFFPSLTQTSTSNFDPNGLLNLNQSSGITITNLQILNNHLKYQSQLPISQSNINHINSNKNNTNNSNNTNNTNNITNKALHININNTHANKPKAFANFHYAIYQCHPCEKTWIKTIEIDPKTNQNIKNQINNNNIEFTDQTCSKCFELTHVCKTDFLELSENNEYYYNEYKNGLIYKWQRIFAVFECNRYQCKTTWTSNNIWMTKNPQNENNTLYKCTDYSNQCPNCDTIYSEPRSSNNNNNNSNNYNNNNSEEILLYENYKEKVLNSIKLIENASKTEDLVPMRDLKRRFGYFECCICEHRWASAFTWTVPYVEVGWYEQDCQPCLKDIAMENDNALPYNYTTDENENFYKVYPIADQGNIQHLLKYNNNNNNYNRGFIDQRRIREHKGVCHYCMLLPKSCLEIYYEKLRFKKLQFNEYIGNFRGNIQKQYATDFGSCGNHP